MKAYELITLVKEPLKRLSENNINISYVDYIDMFHEYKAMTDEGLKKTYIIASLCEKYMIGRTKFLELINSFDSEI